MNTEITKLTSDSEVRVDKPVIVPNIAQWIYKSIMEEPRNWIQYDHTLKHKRTGIAIWTANTRFDLSIYQPQKIELNLYWKFKIWKAYKTRWMRLVVRDIEAQ